MGQIIKSVCICLSLCLSVRVSASAFSRSHFFVDFHQIWHPKVRTSSLGVNIDPPLPNFTPKNCQFWSRGLENQCKYEKRNICLNCSRIAKIRACYRKSGSGNTTVTSDFWQKVEIRPFCACAMKNMQFGPYLWPNRQKWCTAQQWTCELGYGADTMFHRTYF